MNRAKEEALEQMKKNGCFRYMQAYYISEIAKVVQDTDLSTLKMYKNPKKSDVYLIAADIVAQYLNSMSLKHTFSTIEAETHTTFGDNNTNPAEKLKINKSAAWIKSLLDIWDKNKKQIKESNHRYLKKRLNIRIENIGKEENADAVISRAVKNDFSQNTDQQNVPEQNSSTGSTNSSESTKKYENLEEHNENLSTINKQIENTPIEQEQREKYQSDSIGVYSNSIPSVDFDSDSQSDDTKTDKSQQIESIKAENQAIDKISEKIQEASDHSPIGEEVHDVHSNSSNNFDIDFDAPDSDSDDNAVVKEKPMPGKVMTIDSEDSSDYSEMKQEKVNNSNDKKVESESDDLDLSDVDLDENSFGEAEKKGSDDVPKVTMKNTFSVEDTHDDSIDFGEFEASSMLDDEPQQNLKTNTGQIKFESVEQKKQESGSDNLSIGDDDIPSLPTAQANGGDDDVDFDDVDIDWDD